MRALVVATVAVSASVARADAPPAPAAPATAPAADSDGEAKLSLPTESDRLAWTRPGFRLGIGLAYGELVGLRGAPSGRLLGVALHAGLRLDADWSLIVSFDYARASAAGGLSGLRFAGTLDPTWHVTKQLALAVGFGFGGIVEGRTDRPDVDPLGSTLDTSYTFAERGDAAADLQRRRYGRPRARGVHLGDRPAQLDARRARGDRAVHQVRRLDRTHRARHCAADRARPVLAEHGRDAVVGVRVALTRGAAVVVLVVFVGLGARAAWAQAPDAGVPDAPTDSTGSGSASGSGAPQGTFEAPKPLTSTDVPFPDGAPPITAPVVVTVKLRVDPTGAVTRVDPVTPPQPVFDDAVAAAALQFQFEPGRFDGKPVTVAITFTHTFLPLAPPPPPSDAGPARTSVLRGKLVELGTRQPVTSASVVVEIGGQSYSAQGDATGHFRIELPPGAATVHVYAPSHDHFVQHETLADKQELVVAYLVERDRYDPYEIVIVGEQRREEVSRITLRGKEIQEVPGTFGDPFRVIQALPGVASVVSLLPFPVVRGASPSSTGFLIDGTPIPMLFHLLAGPSVINPDFIDEIQFYPGGAPAPYGGYTAGIVDGLTARGDGKPLVDLDANLLEVGGLVREPIKAIDATVTAAARYGFPGLLLSLATNQASLEITGTTSCASTGGQRARPNGLDGVRVRRARRARHRSRRTPIRTPRTRRSRRRSSSSVPPPRPPLPPRPTAASRRRTAWSAATTARSRWAPTSRCSRRCRRCTPGITSQSSSIWQPGSTPTRAI